VQPTRHYVVLRDDLDDVGVLSAQLVHASGESARLVADLPKDTHAVVCAVQDEAALVAVEAALTALGLPHAAIREPDEPWAFALMAIGIAPLAPHQLTGEAKRFLRRLPLFKRRKGESR
jgi:hypothetical protein